MSPVFVGAAGFDRSRPAALPLPGFFASIDCLSLPAVATTLFLSAAAREAAAAAAAACRFCVDSTESSAEKLATIAEKSVRLGTGAAAAGPAAGAAAGAAAVADAGADAGADSGAGAGMTTGAAAGAAARGAVTDAAAGAATGASGRPLAVGFPRAPSGRPPLGVCGGEGFGLVLELDGRGLAALGDGARGDGALDPALVRPVAAVALLGLQLLGRAESGGPRVAAGMQPVLKPQP